MGWEKTRDRFRRGTKAVVEDLAVLDDAERRAFIACVCRGRKADFHAQLYGLQAEVVEGYIASAKEKLGG